MPPHKKDIDELSSQSIPSAQAEIQKWEQLVFSFDMDNNDQSQESQPTRPSSQQSRSSSSVPQSENVNESNDVDDAVLLARFAAAIAAAAAGSNVRHDQAFVPLGNPDLPPIPPSLAFYVNPFQHSGAQHPQQPPISSLDLAWNQFIHQYSQPSSYNAQQSAGAMLNVPPFPYVNLPNTTLHQPALSIDTTGTSLTPQQQSSQHMQSLTQTLAHASANSPTTDDSGEAERTISAEEKRRRNTEASARFRIKKKQRTIDLERSVSDLAGRAEELEKEVSDLRRENGWLKEIIMLKSTQFATTSMQQRLALGQVVQAAGINLHLSSLQPNRSEDGSSSSSAQRAQVSETSDEEEEVEIDKKGKGKRPVTKREKG